MDNYKGTFKVVNKDWNQSLPEIFNSFGDALKAQQDWDDMALIEEIQGDSVEVVWTPHYELYVAGVFV